MQFLVKSIASTILGMIGGWLGGYAGFGTSLFISFVFSVIGWYGAKHLLKKYLD